MQGINDETDMLLNPKDYTVVKLKLHHLVLIKNNENSKGVEIDAYWQLNKGVLVGSAFLLYLNNDLRPNFFKEGKVSTTISKMFYCTV